MLLPCVKTIVVLNLLKKYATIVSNKMEGQLIMNLVLEQQFSEEELQMVFDLFWSADEKGKIFKFFLFLSYILRVVSIFFGILYLYTFIVWQMNRDVVVGNTDFHICYAIKGLFLCFWGYIMPILTRTLRMKRVKFQVEKVYCISGPVQINQNELRNRYRRLSLSNLYHVIEAPKMLFCSFNKRTWVILKVTSEQTEEFFGLLSNQYPQAQIWTKSKLQELHKL